MSDVVARLAAEENWADIPGVRIVGAILGIALIVIAIRKMFGGR